MERLSGKEKKIFLTVFIILSIFVQWYGVNANSRVDLTRSIAEKGELNIDGYQNNTGDRSYYKGNYYSDKAPGLSLLGVPIYEGWKNLYSYLGDTEINDSPRKTLYTVNNDTEISVPESPGGFYLSSLVFLILFTSTLSVSILSILVYRISEGILNESWKRILLTLGFAFGTLITHYGTNFLPAATATLLSFFSFYLLYNWEEKPKQSKMVLAGLSGGLAVTFKSTTMIILVFNAIYAWRKYNQLPYFYVLGGFFGGLPYMLYNTIAFGAFWKLPRSFLDPSLWPQLQESIGLRLDPVRNFFVSLRLLFLPYRGIFYWFPFLLLAPLGLKEFYKDGKLESIIVTLIFLAFTVISASWWAWWQGGWFGARLLVPTIPFLMIPIFYAIRKTNTKVIMILLSISLVINFAGFQGSYEDVLKDTDSSSQMIPEAKEKVESFEPLANPVKNHYIEGFLKRGFQSNLVNSISSGEIPPDIRAYSEQENSPPLPIFWSIILISTIIWNKELRNVMKKHRQIVKEKID